MLKHYYTQNGWNNFLKSEDLNDIENFLLSYGSLTYVGHGGTCIAFQIIDGIHKNKVIKICIKNKYVLQSGDSFQEYSNFLISNGIKILPVIKILYEDNHFVVYLQDVCMPIYDVNTLSIVKILSIIKSLLQKRIKITDLFVKNFGLYKNDIYLYDFHDFGYYYSDDNYYICHIAHLFNLYINKELLHGIDLDIDKLIEIKLGQDILPSNIVELLQSLLSYKYDRAIDIMNNIIVEYKQQIIATHSNYQYIDIDSDGIIHLKKHTLNKFIFAIDAVKLLNLHDFTLIDYGCSLGGIGSSIAQIYPESQIVLNNITESELLICNSIKHNLLLSNTTIEKKNIINDNNSYDICLYFAILHHVLKTLTFDEIILLILKQIKHYAIIELPFDYDVLLKNVISNGSVDYQNTFYFLGNLDIFINKISPYFEIIKYQKIDYETQDLNRYAFLIKKIIS